MTASICTEAVACLTAMASTEATDPVDVPVESVPTEWTDATAMYDAMNNLMNYFLQFALVLALVALLMMAARSIAQEKYNKEQAAKPAPAVDDFDQITRNLRLNDG